MALTDREVRHAQSRAKPYYVHDGDGLYLKVAKTGLKTWFRRSQKDGDREWVKLGNYPTMSLLQARVEADERSKFRDGQRTVRYVWSDYRKLLERNYERPGAIEDRFVRDILPVIGDRYIGEVTRTHCSDLLIGIVGRGSPVAANRTLPDLRHFFEWCCERGWITKNPVVGITRKSVGGRERARTVALDAEQIGAFICDLLDSKRDPRTRLALGLQLCVGQRSTEVLGLHRDEVNRTLWLIPAERTKSRRAHKVYLSPQARAIVHRAFREFGAHPFAGIDHLVLSRVLSRASERLGFKFTPHDIRRTMATRLGDAGVAPHIIEKMLNHQMVGVLAIYNHGEYLAERRAAWRLWGAKLAEIRRKTRENRAISAVSERLRHEGAGVHPADEGGRSVQGAVR